MLEEGEFFQDKTITCVECDEPFIFTAGEQQYYKDKGLTSPPKRCKPCRGARRARMEAEQPNK